MIPINLNMWQVSESASWSYIVALWMKAEIKEMYWDLKNIYDLPKASMKNFVVRQANLGCSCLKNDLT